MKLPMQLRKWMEQRMKQLGNWVLRRKFTPSVVAERWRGRHSSRTSQGISHRRKLACWRSLTPREQQIATMICQHLSNRQIAQRLVLSPNTVKGHVHRVLSKFGVRSKAELRQALEDWDFDALA